MLVFGNRVKTDAVVCGKLCTLDNNNKVYIGWRNVSLEKECYYCGKKCKKLRKCNRCKNVVYCSRTCQKLDWKLSHKDNCNV